jgi:CRP/FNR family transcriptional regulator, nitrogen oxide reductase regulator
MDPRIDEALRATVLYRPLSGDDRARLADVSVLRSYDKGAALFSEGDPSDFLYTIVHGRAKVVKMLASGKEVILEIFGPGDPVGAVVAYEGRPYPATAIAIEPTSCLLVRRAAFFALLEGHPTLARSFMLGLTHRIVELTRRIPEVAGGRVETRFAHLFLKLADKMGVPRPEATFIPMALSRQDLADLTGTTVETCIRIMSRWGKEAVVRTEKEGFLLLDRPALESLRDSLGVPRVR